MPKINQEEYEMLKDLDDEYKAIVRNSLGWIVVTEENPIKGETTWKHNEFKWTFSTYTDNLFQFVQWEDEEPYNIAELIEEYEFENVLSDEERFYELYNANESEETEVKTKQELIEEWE